MYTLVRRFIKTGIVFLGIGIVLGVWMLFDREVRGIGIHPSLVSAHAHAVLAGFVMFLILGVALWLFPRAAKDDRRYTPGRIAAAYWILAIGTTARVAVEIGRVWAAPGWEGWVLLAGGTAQGVGLMLYFWTMWTRIRPVGSHLREARGERF